MKTRRHKYLVATAILLALPLLCLVEERVRGEWLLAHAKRELIAKGEKLTIEELAPPAPEGTNVVLLTPDEAQSMLNIGGGLREESPPTARRLSPGRSVVSWQRDHWFDRDGKEFTWDDYLKAAEGARERLPELRHQLTNRVLRVSLDYGEGWTLMLPHLAGFKDACLALCPAVVYDLHTGNLDGAVENLHAVARLVDLLENEPLLIDQLVRIALAAIAQVTVWEALQADGWTDAQLALLQADWEAMQFTPTMIQALRMERAMNRTYFPGGRNFSRKALRESLAWSGSGLGGGLSGGGGGNSFSGGSLAQWIEPVAEAVQPVFLAARIEVWRHVWAPHDQRFLLTAIQEIVDFGRDALENHNLRPLVNLEERGTNLLGGPLLLKRLEDPRGMSPRFMASELFVSANAKALEKSTQRDAWNRVVVTAIALKRFHVKHGRWPDDLAALVPEFLAEAPLDWMDGDPLRYRLKPDGAYLLYSVGEDGIDQGGDPESDSGSSYSWNGKDYVWPLPATREEVDAADAELVAKAAKKATGDSITPNLQLDLDMMRRYGLIPPAPDPSTGSTGEDPSQHAAPAD